MTRIIVFCLILGTYALTGCAYGFGLSARALPGSYTQVAIPIFKNNTQEVGIEMFFTNALVRRFARSQVAQVTDKENSPLTLEGTIKKIDIAAGPVVTNATKGGLRPLPDNAVLATEYRLLVQTEVVLRRKSDDRVVWQGLFQGERVYPAPRLGAPVVNSADATYNLSVRNQAIAWLADEMMSEAHDRMTENF